MSLRKIIVLGVGLLVLYLIINLIFIRKNNISKLETQLRIQTARIAKLKEQKNDLIQQRKDLVQTLQSIPDEIRSGFIDPERKFTYFMDYIQDSNLEKMNGSIALLQLQVFKDDPVPLLESTFNINFDLNQPQFERFFHSLMQQKDFPLQVRNIHVLRRPNDYPKVDMQLALVIPPKIEIPSFTKELEEGMQ